LDCPWLIFWQWAQRLFLGDEEEERESTLRKLYLYIIVFVAVLSVVISGTGILEGILQILLRLGRKAMSASISSWYGCVVGISCLCAETMPCWFVKRHGRLVFAGCTLPGGGRVGAFLVGLGGIISVIVRYWLEHFSRPQQLLTWFLLRGDWVASLVCRGAD
jgi:hypothetical protein